MSEHQALERHQGTPPVITTNVEYRDSLKRWQEQGYHVLTPFAAISGLAERHGLIATVVQIDPDKAAGEVYDGLPFLSRGEVALAKIGLRKIAEAGAISTLTVRTDPRTILHYWEMKCAASYRGIDGATVVREATAEWDLRDGSPRLKGWTQNQISEGRKNGLRNCETRGVNAAIREFGVRQKYTRDELAKPFVVVRVIFQPDMTDPLTRRIVTERAIAGTSALYPGHALPPGDVVDADPVTATAGQRNGATAPPADAAKENGGGEFPEGFGLVQKLEVKELQRRDGKSKFSKWVAVDHNGVEHVSIKREFGEALQRCYDAKTPVEIVSAENSCGELEVSEITPLGAAQQASLLGDEPKL